ncbi:small oligopeptide transporter [Vararia minispora EC-137]|uniref:Small oligopeptide transporter n=1 Tax=Vararia minispora EC-137 TaxID=1314806 RepID=A0ACB8QL73_9AGAM|nr:small oligopeptide transporter [Vararia minispora EC-137]
MSFQDEKHSTSDADLEKGAVPYRDVVAPVADIDEADPNFDPDAVQFEDDSPYPEVRSAVSNTDDPEMPASTLRAWIVGTIWAILIPGVNQFFFFRYPSVTIGQLVPLLLSFPIMRFWARFVPHVKIFGASLNPGPFTIKEHVIMNVMATVGYQSAYATDIIAVQRVFYNQNPPFGYQWLLVMSTQLIGFSLGGICKRFLVAPPSMIWPTNLVTATLFNTLHGRATAGSDARGGMSRERFFLWVFCVYFCWNFVPTYLFAALSYFPWVTWIAPNNRVVNQLFGTQTGLAMSIITFDWAQIAYSTSPLPIPWWAIGNIGFAVVFFYWLITPILYYTNTWYSAYLPLISNKAFDNTGARYNVTKILTPEGTFDPVAYQKYSPLFLPAAFAMSYGLSFAAITSIVVHIFLYYRKQIWLQARRSLSEQPDIHARLMSVYKEVPEWWYGIIFAAMFVFGIVVIEVWNTGMPVWAFIVALLISFVLTIPIGIIQAITANQLGLNVITELIIGYMIPGKPVPMMMFKTWGYITMAQALQFTQDLKLGHYMKISPRPMFWCQVFATVVAGTVQLGVQSWMFSNIKGICTSKATGGFTCPSTTVFGTASVIWGVIGPQRQFSQGQMYYGLTFFFLAGAVLPAIQYVLHKKFHWNWLKYVNFPVIFSGTGLLPPATPLNYVPFVIVGFIFNYVVRRRNFTWWAKYNYVLSAGLDSAYAVGTIIIFFCLQYPRSGTIGADTIQTWWGNLGYSNTVDGQGTPYLDPPAKFGPSTW